jgi:hypothetical protein
VLSLPPNDFPKCVAFASLYNFLLMRSSFLLLSVALLLWCSFSVFTGQVSIGVVGTVTSSAFECLKTAFEPDYLQRVMVRLYRSSNTPVGIDPNGAQTIINSIKQGIYTVPYV